MTIPSETRAQSSHVPYDVFAMGMKSMKMVESPNTFVPLAIMLTALFVTIILCLIFVPWQQSVPGHGQITIFSPMERPQSVNVQIDGRIKKWHVAEGDVVNAGDVLLEIQELKPKFLDERQIDRLKEQREALLAQKNAVQAGVVALRQQTGTLGQIPGAAIPAAEMKIRQAEQKLKAAEQKFVTADLNLTRRKELYGKGLRSKRDLELAELDYANAKAGVDVASQETQVAQMGRTKVQAESYAKVQDAQAKLAKSQESLGKINQMMLKLDIDISNLESRIEQRTLLAPVDGQITRVLALGRGETVKAGEQVALVVPESADQAVAMYISDFNAPLVAVGRPVRLQFSGWPALQFSGWPSIAVGTFAGRVAVVDAVDDGLSRYRVLVRPDHKAIEAGEEAPWPKYPYLRPGTQANGWIMLDTVSVGFELWRQFNGFPPVVKQKNADNDKGSSATKVPLPLKVAK
ncbi:MAG: HlyD family secretion protein [Vampirovibrio sp.]|nr:HlyD family secretion protein [Vampirovibrio sp.]